MKLPEPHVGPGLPVFDSLRAEQETAWLARVFVSPHDWGVMIGMRSSLILGESGSGKTALRLALATYAEQAANVIPVTWKPVLPARDLAGSALVYDCAQQILNASAKSLLQYFGQRPHSFVQAPDWVQHMLHWFVYHHIQEDHSFFLQRLQDELPREGFSLVASLITTPLPHRVLSADAPPMHVVAQIIPALRRLGLQGIWVLADGLEPWLEVEHQRTSGMLQTWLAALSFFEEPNFAIKLVVPTALEPALVSTSGVSRRRLDVFRLAWTPADLTHIVEQRLAIATEESGFGLHDLCAAPGLTRWLAEFGGDSPRGWLELIRPLIELYLARSPRMALDHADWERVRRRHLPLLHLDMQSERVFLGYREVPVGPTAFRVLRHLYEQRPRTCSRDELYYRVILNLSYVPREAGDRNWQYPAKWEGVLETTLWRIRKVLELNPRSPDYIITERNKGVRLNHTI